MREQEKKPAQSKRGIRKEAWETNARGGWAITLERRAWGKGRELLKGKADLV